MADVLFLTPNLSSSVKHEINGTLLLATLLLADGFDAQILRFSEIEGCGKDYPRFIDNFVAEILARKPKCVSFYTIWSDLHIALRLCKRLRVQAPEIKLVMGGPQSSILAQETLEQIPEVDFVCTGEGENTVVPFFRRMLRGEGVEYSQIPGLYYRDGSRIICNTDPIPPTELNTLPYWDDRLLMKEYPDDANETDPYEYYMPIDVGRGCPFNCTFCSTSVFWKRKYRLKKADRIIADIKYFINKFGYRSYLLAHDALTADRALTIELCDQIIAHDLGIHWECSTRIDLLTPELLQKMEAAGCKSIQMGIETGSERMQKLTRKNLDLSKTRSMLQTILSTSMRPTFFFVYGVPEETEEDFNDTLNLLFDLCDWGAPEVRLSLCIFTPGTDLVKRYYDQFVFEPEIQSLAMSKFGCWDEVEMIKEHKALFTTFYHIHTTVRDKYPCAKYLSSLYQSFPKTARFARQLYKGDHLQFCRDFHENNPDLVSLDIPSLEKKLNAEPLQIFLNTIKNTAHPALNQVRELLRFEDDYRHARMMNGDNAVKRSYNFSYLDLMRNRPIEKFSTGITSELAFVKKGENISISVLNIK